MPVGFAANFEQVFTHYEQQFIAKYFTWNF